MQSAETGVFWEYKLENKNRQKAEIQEDYDSIAENSPYVSRSEDFLFYIANLNRIRLRMRRFSSGFKHREIRSLLFSSRQRKQDLVKDELLGVTPPHPAGLIKKLASHMLLILTDEYNTSQVHAGCQQRLTSIPYDEEVCGHRKTRERATYRVEGPQGGFIPKEEGK
ncbi:hypothetical protein BDB00DRAFT_789445 [Zychaea mexicana]|uniref:uncharacterized protein n=1 Tax=Zychaea mexicana TaxID=64656 RepID=UPI0022FE5AEC|nr:uncharacterized protein BDB00DRAFT_789445 [Zychaea mexicana]KAI9491618.1 hypothetical protein BDB00DRAFT_789445 [Zychaea mexicana]